MNAFEIIKSCENNWDVNKNDCCKFVNAVAADFGIDLYGTADEIIDALSQNWTFLHGKGIEAKYYADSGRFIVAGLRSSDHNPPRHHGHVVIIVSGNLDRGLYPTGYWGSEGSPYLGAFKNRDNS